MSQPELFAQLHAALAACARERLNDGRAVAAADMQLAFMRPAQGALQASARVTGGGKSVCFCEAELQDATGQPVARAMGTFRYGSERTTHPLTGLHP